MDKKGAIKIVAVLGAALIILLIVSAIAGN